MKFLKDLFMGGQNEYWDEGRILAAVGTFLIFMAEVWNMLLGLPIEIDKVGVAEAAVLTASAALIYAKDRAKTENTVAKAVTGDTK